MFSETVQPIFKHYLQSVSTRFLIFVSRRLRFKIRFLICYAKEVCLVLPKQVVLRFFVFQGSPIIIIPSGWTVTVKSKDLFCEQFFKYREQRKLTRSLVQNVILVDKANDTNKQRNRVTKGPMKKKRLEKLKNTNL